MVNFMKQFPDTAIPSQLIHNIEIFKQENGVKEI